jgi:1-acyl-sn-glycerol-3-phosphate acyltransferase
MRYLLGRLFLWLAGWTLEGERDLPPRFVFIAAPHTSNWDLPLMLLAAWQLRARIHWLGKHTLFAPPLVGRVMRALGGIAVDRSSPHGLVEQVVAELGRRERLILAIPPEGTRRRVEFWKSGFYYIALGASVPIGFGFLDHARRRCGVGGFLLPTGDVRADMDRVRAFYSRIRGRYPELESAIRLREEQLNDSGS